LPGLVDAGFDAVLSAPNEGASKVDVRVAGHQVDTGESLREHAQRRVAEITEKYFSRSVGANVTFGRGPNNDYTCDIVAPVVQGVVLKASYSGREPELAFNGAADRIETQLRRYTNRLKEHKVDEAAQAYVENAAYTIFAGGNHEGDKDQADFPAIVAETRVDIPESSVSNAVMLMDLRNTPALLFKNSATGEFNMIYRREDGNIGWVEPHTD
jgi:ribosomal subunit interface protein